MHRLSTIIGGIIIGGLLIFIFEGCATDASRDMNELTAENLLARGIEKLEENSYNSAVTAFQAIKDRYPYSKAVITAELKMAEAHYIRKDFESAFDVYDDFERLHPKDENIPYVMYRKGMCHFQQIKTVDRDQTPTHKAKEEFERLVKRFAKSDYADKARAKIRQCLVYLAEYELYIGDFYFKTKKYGPALERYMYIIKNYPDMGQYHQALEYISKCKEKLAEAEK
ncbi:outer membrane protein assembly factor BamD [Deltaproteobacteria bacterium]|nr:outer membrane protein assembly factor BamD [Deltaproteobacteria bacterium]